MIDDDVPDCPGVMLHTVQGQAWEAQRIAARNNPRAISEFLARRREDQRVEKIYAERRSSEEER
jgi:hypothetical protein